MSVLVLSEARDLRPIRAEVTDPCALPDTGASNQTQALCKGSMCS